MHRPLLVLLLLPACTNELTFNPFDGTTTTGEDGGPANSSISTSGISATAAITATWGDTTTVGVDASGTTQMAGTGTGTGTESSTGVFRGSSSDSGSSSETQAPAAPVVVAFTPAAGSDGVPSLGALSVTFDQPMSGPTVSANVGNDDCTGSIQLSGDGFVTCVRMTSPPQTDDDLTFLVVPAAPLSSLAHYDFRVLETAQAVTATPLDAPVDLRGGFTVQYFHAIAVDGVNDFDASETFATSTPGHTAYTAWDNDFLYLAFDSPDVAAGDPDVWLVAYLSGLTATTLGQVYNTQEPALPFQAQWHLRWRASNDFTDAREWDGAAWADTASFEFAAGSVFASGTFVELRIPLAAIGAPATVQVHMGMLREQTFNEASWGAHPSGSYVDSYDPDYGQYWAFGLDPSPIAPADHSALP